MSRQFRVVVLQRLVPHYRRAVFRRAYEELGWVVATGDESPGYGFDVAGDDEPWLHRFPMRRSQTRQYATVLNLKAVIAALSPDAVLAEFSLQMSSTWQLALRRAIGCKPQLAFWSQGPNVERGFAAPLDLVSQGLRLGLMRSADAQLCYTGAGAAYLTRHMPGRQGIFVAPNTLDVAALQAVATDASPADGSHARLLLIGRMTHDKHMERGVEAVAILRRRMPNITLTIVGDGPAMPAVRAAAEPLGDAASILGAVYDNDRIAAIYAQATMTLVSGSAGLNINQSMGHGVPVMLFDDPVAMHHHPEHVYVRDGFNGYRVAPPTVDAMAERLAQVLAGPSPRRSLAAGVTATVRDDMSMDRMIDGMRALNDYLAARE